MYTNIPIFVLLFLTTLSLIPSVTEAQIAMNTTDASRTNSLWMGIRTENISLTLAQKLGLNESTGVVVTEVTPGGPAQKAGLRSPQVNISNVGLPPEISDADVILKADNTPMRATTDIISVIENKKVGDNITLDVLRDGQMKRVIVTPVPKPDSFLFHDPEGLYSVEYPANWTALNPERLQQLIQQSERLQQLMPTGEMIQNLAAAFVKPGSGTSITITKNPGSAAGISEPEMEKMVDEEFARALIQQNGTIIEDVECDRYKVGSSKSCSYVIGLRSGLPTNVLPNNVMQVLTIAGEKAFVFTYSSLPENFEKDLPVLEEMLQSFNRTSLS